MKRGAVAQTELAQGKDRARAVLRCGKIGPRLRPALADSAGRAVNSSHFDSAIGPNNVRLLALRWGGIAMRLLRSRARVQVDDDTQVEGQVERAVEIFSRVEDEIRDFVGRDLAASRHRLENCSDLTPANVASLLQRLSGNTMQEIDQFIAELQALRQRLQHEATLVEREVVHYANLTEAARASMRTISESLSWQKQ